MGESELPDIALRFVWQNAGPDILRDVGDYWVSHGFLTREEVDERAKELCAVAYSNGKIVAVSTARPVSYQQTRCRFFYYRTTVAPDCRRQHLAARLCAYSRDRLMEWARDRPEERFKGLLVVLQAEEFRSLNKVPVARTHGLEMVFVGYNDDGEPMRIVWFPDATIE